MVQCRKHAIISFSLAGGISIASDKINFGDDDLSSIIKAFNIEEYFPDGKPQTNKILKNDHDHSVEFKIPDSKIRLRSPKSSGSNLNNCLRRGLSIGIKRRMITKEDLSNLEENIRKFKEKNQK